MIQFTFSKTIKVERWMNVDYVSVANPKDTVSVRLQLKILVHVIIILQAILWKYFRTAIE